MKHTKVIKGHFENVHIKNWNDMLAQSHIVAYRKLGDWTKLKDMSIARIAKAERSENGFHYLEDIDISIQRRSANKSWEAIKHLAIQLNIEA